MECRTNCGACCIIPSISSPLPGMPKGKPAFERCAHLAIDFSCMIFDSLDRPKVCYSFKAEELVCGSSQQEAMDILTLLEKGIL